MDDALYRNHLAILEEELVCALGCTEPIAVAYAAALAREALRAGEADAPRRSGHDGYLSVEAHGWLHSRRGGPVHGFRR